MAWASLATLVAVFSWILTLWITRVSYEPGSIVGVLIDEQSPVRLRASQVSFPAFQRDRYRIPRVVVIDQQKALLVVPPGTRSITLMNPRPTQVTCTYNDSIVQRASLGQVVEANGKGMQHPLAISVSDGNTFIPVPESLRAAIARVPDSQGLIRCNVSSALATSPTFTDRSLTLDARNGTVGSVIFDVSALEDIDNLRFSGGIYIPLLGDRTRVLDSSDTVVQAEWVDVSAQEQRDIILVIIGALAAIAAAMWIEAIRPFIERSEK